MAHDNDNDAPDGLPKSERSGESHEITEPRESVGFCRPPQATRFKKGVSGNPKGRPKGSLNVARAFTKALREKVVIHENGKRKTVTKLEAALKQLVNKGASGELRALRQLVELARDAEATQTAGITQEPVLNDLDEEVLQDLMKRFEVGEDQPSEVSRDDQPE